MKPQDHPDLFLLRERRETEALAGNLGRGVVDKLDPLLLRELLHNQRQRQFDATFGISSPEQRWRVVIVMKSARQELPDAVHARAKDDRRAFLKKLHGSAMLSMQRVEDDLSSRGVEVIDRFWIGHAVAAEMTTEEIRAIAMRADVASIVSNKERLMSCLDQSRALIKADQVQALGINGTGVLVAVVDTGVDMTHAALAGVVVSQTDLTGAGGATAEGIGDMVGHGTHCAGIVASQDGTFRGIAPGATIADIKIMRNDGAGGGTGSLSSSLAGLAAAVTAGARVASCSWGFSHKDGAWKDPPSTGANDGTCAICTAVDNTVTAGVVVVVAAGNEDNSSCGSFDTHLDCPGLARTAITVAASDKSDDMADFSSVGPTPQGRTKPDITAPGVDIGSCRASGTSFGDEVDDNPTFTRADGTSMATPHVAGVAALMISKTTKLTPVQVKSNLLSTALDIGAATIEQGVGRVDALAAVNAS
jgi:serine protease AprX